MSHKRVNRWRECLGAAAVALAWSGGPLWMIQASAMGAAGDLCLDIRWCDNFDAYVVGEDVVGQDCDTDSCPDDDNPAGCPDGLRWTPWDDNDGESGVMVALDPLDPANKVLSVATGDNVVHTYHDLEFSSGVHQLQIDVYIPRDYVGDSVFTVFDRYDPANGERRASEQILWSDTGFVVSQFDFAELPLIYDEWVTLRVTMDVDNNRLGIFYGEDLLVEEQWCEGVTCFPMLQAVNLFGNDASAIYYDNIQICETSPLGGCCAIDGTCTEDRDRGDCEKEGGVFQGFGSSCTEGLCPVLGPNGWEVNAPLNWGVSQGRNELCDTDDTCEDIYQGPDTQLAVSIPWPSNWTFSTSGSEIVDTEMLIGDEGICSSNIVNNGGCAGPSCSGTQDGGESGAQAVFVLVLGEGASLNVDIEESDGECGKFNLSVQAPCADICLPDGLDEGEPCNDDTNGGCNADVPVYTPIACGDTYVGTSFETGLTRDTDWYELVVTQQMIDDAGGTLTATFAGKAEASGAFLFAEVLYEDGHEGSGNCDDITGFLRLGAYNRCISYPGEDDPAGVSVDYTEPGTYWFFAASGFTGVNYTCDEDPGKDYWVHLDCVGDAFDCVDCPPCEEPKISGDVDGSGCVDFDDLLLVLTNWDSNGSGGGDNDCTCAVDFNDLLAVLSGFGDGDC